MFPSTDTRDSQMSKKSCGQQRIEHLSGWLQNISIPGMSQEVYVNILDCVLRQQEHGGWSIPSTQLKVVMTAVVLKALAALRFKRDASWRISEEESGSVEAALAFLAAELKSKRRPEAVGED